MNYNLKVNKYYSIVILISPVSVVISHFSSAIIFGTSTFPVSLSAKITLSVSKLPVTFPVSVLTKISLASLDTNLTSPVSVSILNFSDAITFSNKIFPVSDSENKFLHLVLTILRFPVEVDKSSLLAFILLIRIFPVSDSVINSSYSFLDKYMVIFDTMYLKGLCF